MYVCEKESVISTKVLIMLSFFVYQQYGQKNVFAYSILEICEKRQGMYQKPCNSHSNQKLLYFSQKRRGCSLEISYINEFITLSHTCHYQMTAELMFISQSSLSKHIKKMEEELGAELFVHSRHNVQLTEFGKMFLPYAEEIAAIEHQYTSRIQEMLSPKEKEITLGVMSVEALMEVADMLPEFKKAFPGVTLKVSEGNRKDVLDWLKSEQLNIILLRNRAEAAEENYYFLKAEKEQPLVALISRNNVLAKYDTVPFESLRNEIFISSRNLSLKRQLTEELCKSFGFNLSSNLVIQSSSAVIRLVENNMGILILFRDEALAMSTEGTKLLEFTPTRNADTFLYYPKKRKLYPEEQWIIKHFKKKWIKK